MSIYKYAYNDGFEDREYEVSQTWYFHFLKNGKDTRCQVHAHNEANAEKIFWRGREDQTIKITKVEFWYQDEM